LKFSFGTINFVVDMADQGGPEYGDSLPPPPPLPAARRGGDYFDAQQSGVDSYADRAANGDRKREHSSHEPKREREKTRDKDRGDRDRDRDHRPRDDRDRDRDRGDRDRGGHRGYDHERWSRDPDHGRDRRDQSHSNSLGRFRDRSRSQSPSESQSLERRRCAAFTVHLSIGLLAICLAKYNSSPIPQKILCFCCFVDCSVKQDGEINFFSMSLSDLLYRGVSENVS
jgi:hypothetical protein